MSFFERFLTKVKIFFYQCPAPHGHAEIQLFQKFAMGANDEKLKNFSKSKKNR